MNSLIQTIDVN